MDLGRWVRSGRLFSAEEIAAIRTTAAWLPGLARKELAATLCEHLDWDTLTGTPKLRACGEQLGRLEVAGLLEPPAVRPAGRSRWMPLAGPLAEADEAPLRTSLAVLGSVRLEVVRAPTAVVEWDSAVARWHPLGFKGALYCQRYFIIASDRRLGCLLLAGAARALTVRDQLIAWDAQARREHAMRVLNNSR